jgi:hypothetical protein
VDGISRHRDAGAGGVEECRGDEYQQVAGFMRYRMSLGISASHVRG